VRARGLFLCLTLSAMVTVPPCSVPARIHPHMLRHSRAMHLYQAGMPLALLTEWLGHADPETTLIYAHADTEMKRQALEKANIATIHNPLPTPLWHGREDIIQRLCGLKD